MTDKMAERVEDKTADRMTETAKQRSSRRRCRIAAGLLLLLIAGWLYWGNTSIQVTQLTVESVKLPEAFDGFVLAQVSDLHNAEFGEGNRKLLELLSEAQPDLIAVTGDLIDSNRTNVEIAVSFMEEARKIAPVCYVTGNHEARVPEAYEELQQRMDAVGVVTLADEGRVISRDGTSVTVLGLSDPDFTEDNAGERDGWQEVQGDAVEQRLAGLTAQTDDYTILLSHRPELFEVYCAAGVDLALSGHAHGGQFRIPFVGGLVAPHQGLFPDYTEGLYEKGNTAMVVSRGLGNSIIPLRINNRPELVVVTLRTMDSL